MKITRIIRQSPPCSATIDAVDAAADTWSSGSDEDGHQMEVPNVSPSVITIRREYSAVDFDFVDSSWLPNLVAGSADSSIEDEDFI